MRHPFSDVGLNRYDALSLASGKAMKRREFITLLGSAATWPLAARAQQPERMRRIGVLTGLAEIDPDAQSEISAFRQGLQRLGWTGRNARIVYRWGNGEVDRIRTFAREFTALQPDAVLAVSTAAVRALMVVDLPVLAEEARLELDVCLDVVHQRRITKTQHAAQMALRDCGADRTWRRTDDTRRLRVKEF